MKPIHEFYRDVYGRKSKPERYILLNQQGETVSTPIVLKTANSIKALSDMLDRAAPLQFPKAVSVYDTKLNKTIEVIFLEKSTWRRTGFKSVLPTQYKDMFSNKPKPKALQNVTEASSNTFTLDSYSASDSDKIVDFLNTNKIAFKKLGSKITIDTKRSEIGAASIKNKLKSLAKFDELNEVNLNASKLSPSQYQQAKKLKAFKASNWKWNADEHLYVKVNKDMSESNKSVTELIESVVRQTIMEAYEPVMFDPMLHTTLDSGAMDYEYDASNPNTINVFAPFKEEPNVMVHMKINKKYFDDLLDDGYIESQEDLDAIELESDVLRGAIVTLMQRPELLKKYNVMTENVILELNLSSAGVKEFLMFIKRYPKYLHELGFASFKILLNTIKSGDVNVVYELMQELMPVLKKETNPRIKQDAMALMH